MNTVVFIPVLVPIDRLMSIRIWIAFLYEADTEAPKIMHTDPLPSPNDAACFRYESTTVKAIKWVIYKGGDKNFDRLYEGWNIVLLQYPS